jgi:hypothetical protein
MGNLRDRASYIRGLVEGMKVDQSTNEGKLLGVIIELLNEMASSIEEAEKKHLELSKYVDDIDDSVINLEDTLDSILEDDDDDDDDDEEESSDSEDWIFESDDDDEDDEGGGLSDIFVECMCPLCKAVFYAEEEDMDRDIDYICPSCEKRVRPNIDYEDEIPFGHRADGD